MLRFAQAQHGYLFYTVDMWLYVKRNIRPTHFNPCSGRGDERMPNPTEPQANRKTGSIPRVEVEPEKPKEPPELPEFRDMGAITGRIVINLHRGEGHDAARKDDDTPDEKPAN